MDERRTTENRIFIVALTVLIVMTVAVFAFCFLGGSDLFAGGNDTPTPDDSSVSTDGETTDSEQLSSIVAEVQGKMNNFQTLLDSPYLLPVDDATPLPEGYEVGELVALDGYEKMQLESVAAGKMNEFLAAAKKAGFAATVTAAYRSEKQQEKAYNDAVQDFMNAGYPAETARTMAASSVGAVNRSEHQLGFAVDFSKKEMTLLGNDGSTFEEFVSANMPKYGFILSYPAGGEDKTGHDANTVHYRFVGVEPAEAMTREKWTLGEYRNYLQTQLDYLKQYLQSLSKK